MELREYAGIFWTDLKEIRKVLKLKRDFVKNQSRPSWWMERIQRDKLRRILRHAVSSSAFYREFYKDINIEECSLQDLPVLTKATMMENYDELVTDPRLNTKELTEFLSVPENAKRLYKDNFVILNSSGTTGQKAITAYTWDEFENVFAVAIARGDSYQYSLLSLLKSLVGESLRVANIMIINGHSASFICSTRFCPVSDHPMISNRFFSVFTPIDELCAALNTYQPHIIQAYSTVFNYLAYEQMAGRLKLDLHGPKSSLVSLSEPLSQRTRELVKKAFGRDIINTYGACESIIMARECDAHRGMHINSDLVIMEVVDEQYNPVPVGEIGNKILITNLYAFAQPMIRYELHDRVALDSEPCSCGSRLPLIKSVEGRTEEILWISKPGGGFEPVHPYLFLVPVLNNQGIREFQVEQIERNTMIFRVVPVQPGSMTSDDLVDIMEKSMQREGYAGRMSFIGEIMDAIPRDPVSGKIVQVTSRVGCPAGVESYDSAL